MALGDYKDAAEYVKHFVWRQIGIGAKSSNSQEFYQYDDNGYRCGICTSYLYVRYTWSTDHRSATSEYGRTLTYDEQGNLISDAGRGNGITETYTYDFNEDGSIAHRYEKYVKGSYTADGTTEYKYDEEGRLTETVEEYTSSYSREHDGKVPERVTTSTYSYDNAGRLLYVERTTVYYNKYSTSKSEQTDVYGWVYAPNATE